jgi:hypothetical protein
MQLKKHGVMLTETEKTKREVSGDYGSAESMQPQGCMI